MKYYSVLNQGNSQESCHLEVSYCECHFWPKCENLVAQLKMAVEILMGSVVVAVTHRPNKEGVKLHLR